MITDEITARNEQAQMQMEQPQAEQPVQVVQQDQAYQTKQAQAVKCPNCGATNDAEAMYCATCGQVLGTYTCPNCGCEVDPEADYCESCHHYIRQDICSFCGAQLADQEQFCHECGAPRGGIVCPTCHTLNEFSFCKQCGRPLTDEAVAMVNGLKTLPQYKELVQLAREMNQLQMELPFETEQDAQQIKRCDDLRERVLRLLAQDAGVAHPVIAPLPARRVSKDELDAQKAEVNRKITELLDAMAIPPMPKPAQVRNYAMAQKPAGVRLAWVCNWKHAMHSSPCGCAKPQLGGKWVILGQGTKQEIKDDK